MLELILPVFLILTTPVTLIIVLYVLIKGCEE